MFAVKYMSKQIKHIKNVSTTVKIFQNDVTYVVQLVLHIFVNYLKSFFGRSWVIH